MALVTPDNDPRLKAALALWVPGTNLPDVCWDALRMNTRELFVSSDRVADPHTTVLRKIERKGRRRNEIALILADGRSVEFPLDTQKQTLTAVASIGLADPDKDTDRKELSIEEIVNDENILPMNWRGLDTTNGKNRVYIADTANTATRGNIAVREKSMDLGAYYAFEEMIETYASEAATLTCPIPYPVMNFQGVEGTGQSVAVHLVPKGYVSATSRTPCIWGYFGGTYVIADLTPELVEFYQGVLEMKKSAQ